jgi:GT2 family glycosyltransferase/spore maturation protein CgeB
MPILTVLYVVRNEQDFIKKSLDSIKAIADNIVVIDTGSRDKTLHICRQYRNLQIFTHAWAHDYSKTKNYGIAQCKGDWILSLDADEMLDPASAAAVRSAANEAKPNTAAFSLHVNDYEQAWDWKAPRNPKSYFPATQVRLFRRSPSIIFEGRVLESIEKAAKRSGGIDLLNASVCHYLWRGKGKAFGQQRIAYYNKLGAGLVEEQSASIRSPANEAPLPQTAIVIPAYNMLALTKECVESITRHTESSYCLQFVDSASSDGTYEYMRGIVGKAPIRLGTNYGPAKAKNVGTREILADPNIKYVCFLDNDTKVSAGWLDGMLAVLNGNDKIGLVGPLSLGADGPQSLPQEIEGKFLKDRNPEYILADSINGFCMLAKIEVLRRIGLFDESFGQYGYEDADLCMRVRQAGYEIAVANRVFVDHKGKATLIGNRIEWARLSQASAIKFAQKWNKAVPAEAKGPRSGPIEYRGSHSKPRLPKFSIIILTHNRLDVTTECVESILKNTSDFELIIVDNGSTDNTVSWIKTNAPFAKIIQNEKNLGVIVARNQGIRSANTEYLVLMDNDVVVSKGWIEEMFEASQEADIVGLEGWQLDYNHAPCLKCASSSDRMDYLGGACNLFKRKVFETAGMLDEGFGKAYFEDVDISIRAKAHGFKLKWLPTSKIVHKEHATLIYGQKDFVYTEALSNSYVRFAAKMRKEIKVDHERLPPLEKKLNILYLGMYWDYGIRERGTSFEQDNFYPALRTWNRTGTFTHFDFVELGKIHGVPRMSEMLYEKVHEVRPDVIFGVWFDENHDPRREMLDRIRKTTPTKVVSWFCDSFFRYESFDRHWANYVDFCVTCSTEGYNKYVRDGLKAKAIKSQFAAAPSYAPIEGVQRDIDVSFVGQPHGDRRHIISVLRSAGINVQAYGTGWEKRLSFSEMVSVFNRSKINLNLSNGASGTFQQIKGRNFEVPACRAFMLTGAAENLYEYYDYGKEIVVFNSTDELVSKVRYYLSNYAEREQIASAGYARTVKDHTYAKRFDNIFKEAGLI